ncbi:MAG TPA: MerR family transcriptional regulator, partial [candidate division WWE3 bacterium]|nr:MerR family transcriptional regulator [candidate division WWE3 bacterium]
MTTDLLNQENERLIPVNEVERLSGVPYNTLRYYTKIGLLPHMKRKRPHPEATSTVGHYPQSVLKLLQRIEEFKAQGLSNDEIKKKLHEKEKTPQNAVSEGISQEEKPPQPPVSVPQPPPLDLIPVLHEERKQSDLLSQISHFLTNMIHAPLPAREPMWSKVASHALTLLLVFGALAILSFGFSDLTHARIKRLFGGFWDQYVERILPSNVLGIQQVASPIVDVNDVLEYRTGSVRLGTKFPLDVDAIFAKTVNIVEGAVLNTSRFLGTVFFGKSDSYFITPLGVASLKDVRAITISAETIKVKNLEVSGTSVGAGGGQAQGGDADTLEGEAGSYYLNWVNFSNKPTILSSLNTVNNSEGNIDLIAGSNITITPDDGANTITIAATGGGGGGGDANTLDGLDSLSFLRSNAADSYTSGTLTFNAGTTLSIAGSLVLPSSSITGAGAGSGLNADLLDGQEGSYYLSRANHTGTQLSATISDFDEASQDSVGGILTDSSTLDFTYNDALGQITADVLAGGVDHGSLAGLGDDDHAQYLLASGTRALTGNWDAGSFEIRAQTFQSDATTGTAPFIIASTTPVSNLNVDQLDSLDSLQFLRSDTDDNLTSGTLTTDATTTL